ncbi:phage holin family protein [Citrobacter koseri]|uniref:phage holin family protein n=1 Tax=Citrobacter TaxID=544 RepID=UPI002543F3CD|nr:phage holin family protein [Citrobacter portucalensis]WIJ58406.1 phage holin family protein [Citrobacter portucalensis]
MVTLNEFLLMVNAVACIVIATSLGTYQRKGAAHKILGALFALVLMIACGSIAILIICGRYSVANPAETIINVVLCVAVVQARGNAMRIFKPKREDNAN